MLEHQQKEPWHWPTSRLCVVTQLPHRSTGRFRNHQHLAWCWSIETKYQDTDQVQDSGLLPDCLRDPLAESETISTLHMLEQWQKELRHWPGSRLYVVTWLPHRSNSRTRNHWQLALTEGTKTLTSFKTLCCCLILPRRSNSSTRNHQQLARR